MTPTYKSILTYWDSDPASRGRVASAIDLTRTLDAHLTVIAFGYDLDIPPYAMGGMYGPMFTDLVDRAKEEAQTHAKEAHGLIEREGVAGEAVPVVSTFGGLVGAFGRHAQFADLVVLGQPYGIGNETAAVNLLEGVLFDGDAATLLQPAVCALPSNTAVIAWNGSREALRAVRRAIPLLRLAKRVEVSIVDPSRSDGNPGDDLALMLARHGLAVEVTVLARAGQGTSDVLRRHLEDVDADLLVMGAYGHSRFRERIFGGVTHDVFQSLPVPVLTAH